MTREMIKQIERDYWEEKADPIDMAEVFDLAQKALEQEPVIDKIRAEIKGMTPTYHNPDWSITDLVSISEVLKLVDKYKAETEVDNGNDD